MNKIPFHIIAMLLAVGYVAGRLVSEYKHTPCPTKYHEAIGFNAALDTVLQMQTAALASDTSITKFVIVNPDTHVFFLQRREPLTTIP